MHQVLFVVLILFSDHIDYYAALQTNIDIDTILDGTTLNVEGYTKGSHCKDIDGSCQEWATNGKCYDTDFVRHFCPISCRNRYCTDYFPSFTSKSNHWRQISSTICNYPNLNKSISSNLYFKQYINISLIQCKAQCDNNPFCTHFVYVEKSILAQIISINNDYYQFLTLNRNNNNIQSVDDNNNDNNDNITINICIHSYIALKSCHPICIDSDIINRYLLNDKQDLNTETKTAKLLSPFIFSTRYEYISLFSLYMNENRNINTNWDMVNEFNTRNRLIPYQNHEYYYPQMIDIDGGHSPPMLESPKLYTFPGSLKVRLEFESRVDRSLEVSWVNTRNYKEYFQESLDGDTWSITKARNSFNGHIFVIRDSKSKQWLTTYRNNPFHTNVFITVTPFGVCVRDEYHSSTANILNNNKLKGATIIDVGEITVNKLLKEANQKRWGSNSDILSSWKLYEKILWSTNNKKTIGKVLNLMGEIFLFGSYQEIFDYNMAWSYFKMASIIGNGDSKYNMGFMIENKLLPTNLYHYVPKSLYRIAMLNYWCSAQSHSEKAQLLLGFRYLNGIGMNKSCRHSVFFYQKLARSVRYDARSLDKYVDVIDLSDPPSTAQDLNMDDHQIRYYKQYAAMGRAWANNHLGQVYLFGLRGIAQNYEMAAQHFEAAVNANDPVAANYLGRLYWNGLGRKRNLNKTRSLFKFAAERNVSQAQNNLAYMEWKGIGTKPNMNESLKWFKRAVLNNFAQSMFYLGEIYKNGENGVNKNISMAVEYYIMATKHRHYRSMYELGMLYKDGIGVQQNCEKAVSLFKYVAEYHNVKFELENARRAWETGNYAESFVIYSQKAEEGYINGQINAAFLARNGYHKYLYDILENPFYHNTNHDDIIINNNDNETIKMKRYYRSYDEDDEDDKNGECENNVSVSNFIYNDNNLYFCNEQDDDDDDDDDDDEYNIFDDDNLFGSKYKHQVTIPENKELAFRYYSFAASQNHSRSLRRLGDYYWYQWPPVNLFSYLSNISFDINDQEYTNQSNNNSTTEILQIDEYDQRSMALSIAYLSTPHSIVKYSNIDNNNKDNKDDEENRNNNMSIKVNNSKQEQDAIERIINGDDEYLLRYEVIACYLYELASLQSIPNIDGQSLYDFAYCYEHGKGREKNITKAREIYWMAMNKSMEAWIPVFIILLKMEVVNLYHLSRINIYYYSFQHISYNKIENIILVISIIILIIVLCIKSMRNTSSRDIVAPYQSVR